MQSVFDHRMELLDLRQLIGEQLRRILSVWLKVVILQQFGEFSITDEEQYLKDVFFDPLSTVEVVLHVIIAALEETRTDALLHPLFNDPQAFLELKDLLGWRRTKGQALIEHVPHSRRTIPLLVELQRFEVREDVGKMLVDARVIFILQQQMEQLFI